jgi:hypothetical protein
MIRIELVCGSGLGDEKIVIAELFFEMLGDNLGNDVKLPKVGPLKRWVSQKLAGLFMKFEELFRVTRGVQQDLVVRFLITIVAGRRTTESVKKVCRAGSKQ